MIFLVAPATFASPVLIKVLSIPVDEKAAFVIIFSLSDQIPCLHHVEKGLKNFESDYS
jgi:hypothetical protein